MATLDRLSVRGIDLEVLRGGAGHPVLLLHGMAPLDPDGCTFLKGGDKARILGLNVAKLLKLKRLRR